METRYSKFSSGMFSVLGTLEVRESMFSTSLVSSSSRNVIQRPGGILKKKLCHYREAIELWVMLVRFLARALMSGPYTSAHHKRHFYNEIRRW